MWRRSTRGVDVYPPLDADNAANGLSVTNFTKVASSRELVPVLGLRVMLEKSKPATMGGLEKKKGGRREGDVPAPLKVKLVGGRSTFMLPRVVVGGKDPWLTYSQ
ncbi:hypothetical protein DSM100238_0970 [Bifidobacterium apri]|uniref:Uncharacterized protein n=1 Tax=Bifidobacterium apri TaxID=1769423 RepID=A0A6A2V8G6_9BIFI|nr:hypothetical protein DSM100238_0970 [Bifidobacterium apri]